MLEVRRKPWHNFFCLFFRFYLPRKLSSWAESMTQTSVKNISRSSWVLIIILHQMSGSSQSFSETKLQFLSICSGLIKIWSGQDKNVYSITAQEKRSDNKTASVKQLALCRPQTFGAVPSFCTVMLTGNLFVPVVIRNDCKWSHYF